MNRHLELLRLVFDEAKVDVSDGTLQLVVYALEVHYLLRPFPEGETAEHYHQRVQRAAVDALKKVTGEG